LGIYITHIVRAGTRERSMMSKMAKKIDLTTTTEIYPSTRKPVAITTTTEAVASSSMTDANTEGTIKEENADEGYDLFEEAQQGEVPLSQESSDAVRRKIDLHLLPFMCLLYGLNFIDKVAMGWAALFDFREDLGLVGAKYAWAGAMFYFGYWAGQYPANYLLQRYKTARMLSCAAITWGVLMLA
jgi:ACS family allantoate permease-like MFS transporter